MDFKEYQAKAATTAIYPGRDEVLGFMYVSLGLANEGGEFAGKVKKLMRDQGLGTWGNTISQEDRTELKKELGDVLWYVAMCCYELGISMDDAAELNIAKLASRKERGVIGGSGDER